MTAADPAPSSHGAALDIRELVERARRRRVLLDQAPYTVFLVGMAAVACAGFAVGLADAIAVAYHAAPLHLARVVVPFCVGLLGLWTLWRHRRRDRPYVATATRFCVLIVVLHNANMVLIGPAPLPFVVATTVFGYIVLPVPRARALAAALFAAVAGLAAWHGAELPSWLRGLGALLASAAMLEVMRHFRAKRDEYLESLVESLQRASDLLFEENRKLAAANAETEVKSKLVESERARQQQAVERILERSPVCTVQAAGDRIVYANPAFESKFGIGAGTLANELLANLSKSRQIAEELATRRTLNGREVSMCTAHGEPRDFLVTVAGLERNGRDDWIAWLLDITSLKDSQREVERQRRSLSTIFENSPLCLSITRDGVLLAINPRFAETFGAKAGDRTANFYEDVEDQRRIIREMIGRNGFREYQVRLRTASAGIRDFRVTTTPIEYEGEQAILAYLTDVTDISSAAATIGRQRASLQTILDASPVPLAFHSGGVYRYVSRTFREQFGLEPGAARGSLLSPEDRSRLNRGSRENREEWRRLGIELQLRSATGESRTCIVKSAPVEYEGRAGEMVWATDITDLRRAADEMREARDLAESASRTKAEFLANMSHEIRTPMNAIIGMTQLALQGDLALRERNFVSKANAAAEGLLGILNDILDFSRIEAGKLALESVEFRLEEVFDTVVNVVGQRAKEKHLDLLFHVDPAAPLHIRGDPLRLRQVLLNLVTNAIKFTERGEVVVGVGPRVSPEGRARLHFWVRDSGIGMSKEAASRLFQSFAQADASITRRYGGTGLGLAISRRLVEMMDGKIWVDSTPGSGSTFHFYANLPECSPRADTAPAGPSRRALVVDDSTAFATFVSHYVGSLGFRTEFASDAESALDHVQAADAAGNGYDVLFVDWQLPGMDGVSLAATVQRLPLKRMPEIILVTGSDAMHAQLELERQGVRCSAVLSKPLSLKQIREALHPRLEGLEAATRPDDEKSAMLALAGTKVLLVDDHPMNLELAHVLLRRAGIEVTIARDGAEALARLREPGAAFDGVLMDCQMPVMDGYRATMEIRKDPALKEIPVIALTANAMEADREAATRAGMDDHVAKPVKSAILFATMAKWFLRGRRSPVPVLAASRTA